MCRRLRSDRGLHPRDGDPVTASRTEARAIRAASNQAASVEALIEVTGEVADLLARLQSAAADHFGANPEGAAVWGHVADAGYVAEKLRHAAEHLGV